MPAGGVLDVGAAETAGLRTYVLVAGGFDVPTYLGSASTFTLGRFGGHGGRHAGRRRRPARGAGHVRPNPKPPSRPTFGPRCRRSGNSPSPRGRTARRSSSPARTWTRCSTPATSCTSTRPAPGCASRVRARSGPVPTAARRDCTRRTSTTTPTRLVHSTSPATPRSCWAPTGPASAASSVRSRSWPPTGGSSGSCGRGTRSGSCRSGRPTRRRARSWALARWPRPPSSGGPRATVTTACWRRRDGGGRTRRHLSPQR